MITIQIQTGALKRLSLFLLTLALIVGGVFFTTRYVVQRQDFEIVDDLGGNIFPSAILSTATTDAQIILPVDSVYLGNPKSNIAIRITAPTQNSRIRITVDETPFYRTSVSEFILPEKDKTYAIYPDLLWNYKALLDNEQAIPINFTVRVEMNGIELGQQTRTFSVRGINECLLGYIDRNNKYQTTYIFFAAYVNEDHPLIDEVLREALNTRIVNRFLGYQSSKKDYVDQQVYALWNVLQKRHFRYSSVSNSSLSSNVIFSQRVRVTTGTRFRRCPAFIADQLCRRQCPVCLSAPGHQHRPGSGTYSGAHVRGVLHRQ